MYTGKNRQASRPSEQLWSESRNQYNTETFLNPISYCLTEQEEEGDEGEAEEEHKKNEGGGGFYQTAADENEYAMVVKLPRDIYLLCNIPIALHPGELEATSPQTGHGVKFTWTGPAEKQSTSFLQAILELM